MLTVRSEECFFFMLRHAAILLHGSDDAVVDQEAIDYLKTLLYLDHLVALPGHSYLSRSEYQLVDWFASLSELHKPEGCTLPLPVNTQPFKQMLDQLAVNHILQMPSIGHDRKAINKMCAMLYALCPMLCSHSLTPARTLTPPRRAGAGSKRLPSGKNATRASN